MQLSSPKIKGQLFTGGLARPTQLVVTTSNLISGGTSIGSQAKLRHKGHVAGLSLTVSSKTFSTRWSVKYY